MLDKTNKIILEALKENSRQSVRDIAKKTGLRPSTVHSRIKRMKEEGIIERFTVKTSSRKTGENFVVFILVSSEKHIDNSVFDSPCIKEVFGITGENDLLIKCRFASIEEFNEFILKFRKVPNVNKTITMVATTTIKEEL